MNRQLCEDYVEWMSLAQDGTLNSTQSHLLHAHLATCPSCQTLWAAMTTVSQMFHTTPMIAPTPGFVARFDDKLAYRQEQRRQAMIWVLLSIGVIALTILALPSLISVLGFAGRLVLPYETISYMQGLLNWAYIVIYALVDAASVLLRHFVATPTGLACIGSAAVTGTLIVIWTRLLVGRMAVQGTR